MADFPSDVTNQNLDILAGVDSTASAPAKITGVTAKARALLKAADSEPYAAADKAKVAALGNLAGVTASSDGLALVQAADAKAFTASEKAKVAALGGSRNEALAGVIDGTNRVFNFSVTPVGEPAVFINGVLMVPTLDYSRVGAAVTFTVLETPQVGDTVRGILNDSTLAAGGAGALAVIDESTQITADAASIKFTGAGVTATAIGNAVTVDIASSSTVAGISDATAAGKALLLASDVPAQRVLLDARSPAEETVIFEEFAGITPFADGMTSSTTGGAAATPIAAANSKRVGLLNITSGTTAGAGVNGRVAATAAASVALGNMATHLFGFTVAASSLPGTPTTDDSKLLVGLGNQGGAEGTTSVGFRCTNGGNWFATVINGGVEGNIDTGKAPSLAITGAGLQSSTTVLVSNTTGLEVGMPVFGPNIPANAIITAITTNTNITISIAATATTTATIYAGIWYNFAMIYRPATNTMDFYVDAVFLGTIGPGSTATGTLVTTAPPTATMFPRFMASRVQNTTSNFGLMIDSYIHRRLYTTPRWPTL